MFIFEEGIIFTIHHFRPKNYRLHDFKRIQIKLLTKDVLKLKARILFAVYNFIFKTKDFELDILISISLEAYH